MKYVQDILKKGGHMKRIPPIKCWNHEVKRAECRIELPGSLTKNKIPGIFSTLKMFIWTRKVS